MAEDGYAVNDPAHLEAASDTPYGVYDTQDSCWIGDEKGPRLFTREDSDKFKGLPQKLIARLSARLTEEQLGFAPGRLQAREFDEHDLRLKDTLDTKMTPLEALIKLEGGAE